MESPYTPNIVNPRTGVIDSPDGKRYAGEFFENERSGFGVFVNQNSKDLKSFKGFYKNDLPNGLGEAEYVDGSIYKVGFFKDSSHSWAKIFFNLRSLGTG